MASLTIRKLDDGVKARLRARAARRGRSLEWEARDILAAAVESEDAREHPAVAIRRRFAALGGVELDLPPREFDRDPPDFSK